MGDATPSLFPLGVVRLRWWENHGLHAHISYPDGSWERLTWKGSPYWEIDALVRDLEREYGRTNVQVTG